MRGVKPWQWRLIVWGALGTPVWVVGGIAIAGWIWGFK